MADICGNSAPPTDSPHPTLLYFMNSRSMNDRRIYQDIALKLTEQINAGELADGSLLPSERELAEKFAASRTSIREALLSLQSSGLISMRQRARARVTRLNNPAFFNQLSGAAQSLLAQPNGVADFQEARVLFECGLARYAARHASPKELERLAFALAQNKKALGDAASFAKTDVAFHGILAEIPRNPIFTALNTALSEWLMEQRTVSMRAPVRGAVRRAYEGHEEIYEAIAARDIEAADRAMANHLQTVSEYYAKAVAAKTA
jgi:DNA-binding FadR family transcriptional regulator